ncbi:hypothetical protein DOTSEDRAFT_108824, partial [Dothistroma septosporum NZE10]
IKSQPSHSYLIFLLITALPLYYGSYKYRTRHPYGSSQEPIRKSIGDFVTDWLDTHVVVPFNPYPIAAYCKRTTWRPTLVFNLANANGGIGNVRGNVLDFLFFAIEAGASIMLPGMAQRNDGDLSDVWARRANFDEFFDEKWFLEIMEEACPQMQIYKVQEGQEVKAALPDYYRPRSRRMDEDFGNNRIAYLKDLESWLQIRGVIDDKSKGLTLVNIERSLWDIDTRSLPHGLRRNFGHLLRTNTTIRQLAALIMQNLSLQHALKIDPTHPIPKDAFYAAHLRTESDAQNAGWLTESNTNFTAQTTSYIAHATANKLNILYVATGNASDLARFHSIAASQHPPLTVVSKHDLLPPSELTTLNSLTWDQQALVDYEVLQRSSVFGGFVKSSFSYNVAMTRNQWVEDEGLAIEPMRVQHSEEGVAFDDGWSRVVGRDGFHEGRIPRGMWP